MATSDEDARRKLALRQNRRAIKDARARAKKKGTTFLITAGDVEWPAVCPALGIPLHFGGSNRWNSPSLDRVDPSMGYVPGNVIVVSMAANTIKSRFGWRDVLKVGAYYRDLEAKRFGDIDDHDPVRPGDGRLSRQDDEDPPDRGEG